MLEHNTNHAGQWEKRWHPLRREWIVYAAHRNNRPWQGEDNKLKEEYGPIYDPSCYLCPTNKRVSGKSNPDYHDVYVFENDHPVVGPQSPEIEEASQTGLYRTNRANGNAYVICYDKRHNITLSEAEPEVVLKVVKAWRQLTVEMLENKNVVSSVIFENKGELVGVSNPHPHCQCYALDFVSPDLSRELEASQEYYQFTGKVLLSDILKKEKEDGSRILFENEHAIAFLPFFARFAYEVYILPKRQHQNMSTLSDDECADLAEAYQAVIRKYDMNFGIRFPYVMNNMQAPLDGNDYPHYHFRMQFLPPLRQPGLKKHLAGPELGAGVFMADTIPEEKAAELIKQDLKNYKPLI